MINEVAPPGWGHTKAEKEKTKPNKPKSKIGGTAAAFKRALDECKFKYSALSIKTIFSILNSATLSIIQEKEYVYIFMINILR